MVLSALLHHPRRGARGLVDGHGACPPAVVPGDTLSQEGAPRHFRLQLSHVSSGARLPFLELAFCFGRRLQCVPGPQGEPQGDGLHARAWRPFQGDASPRPQGPKGQQKPPESGMGHRGCAGGSVPGGSRHLSAPLAISNLHLFPYLMGQRETEGARRETDRMQTCFTASEAPPTRW